MNPDDPDGPKIRGIQSPEVVFYNGEAYIAFAMSGGGTGLLKSSTAQPEGPYEMHAQITTAFAKTESGKLTDVKELLGDHCDYGQLRIFRAIHGEKER